MIGKKAQEGGISNQMPKIGMFLLVLVIAIIVFTRMIGDISGSTLDAVDINPLGPVKEFGYLDMCYDGYTNYAYKEGEDYYAEHLMTKDKIKCEYERDERDIPDGKTPCPYNKDIGGNYTLIAFCRESQTCNREARDKPCEGGWGGAGAGGSW